MLLTRQVSALVEREDGRDRYGKNKFKFLATTQVGVVRLSASTEKTTVRADSSASRGRANEIVYDAVLLFAKHFVPKAGDRVTTVGITLEVMDIHPRLDLFGDIDHYEVGLRVWAQK